MNTKYINQTGNFEVCNKCNDSFVYCQEETFWDNKGYGYGTKLVKCPYCGQINIIKHINDYRLDINNDDRYYK